MKIKKVIAVFMTALLLSSFINAQAFAYSSVNYDEFNEHKSKYRLLYGAILIVGGGILAVDGFRTVRTDISKPAVRLNFSSFWYQDVTNYVAEANGTITNTGNVDLRDVKVLIRYKTKDEGFRPDEYGIPITFDSGADYINNFAVNESKTWDSRISYPLHDAGGNIQNEPMGPSSNIELTYVDNNATYPSLTPTTLVDIVNIEYDYTKKYKNETNNPYEGLLGLLLIAGGAYLIIDYVVSLKKFDYYMKKNNMDIYLANSGEEFKLMLNKKI
ncbi:MAG: hypothetical protein FWG57_01260 [Endomicrobia bacterium]|nr:hypothetical protein [Endomicrobiia bacterium]